MKKLSRRRTGRALFEALETRQLLTFQVVSPLSDVTVGPAASTSTVSLANHFHDPDATSTTVRIRVQPYNAALAAGNIDIQLTDTATPATVANFLNYVNSGRYNNTFFHRSIPGFVVQGGGYQNVVENLTHIPTFAPVVNEFTQAKAAAGGGNVNVRGTVAMAKLGGDPNSATSEWFFNLVDNSSNLDNQNGGFTTFGTVVAGMPILDAIAALPRQSVVGFSDLPLAGNGQATYANLVTIQYATANATYAVSYPANGVIASATVTGSQLVFAFVPGKSGTVPVTVTATNFSGATASDTFDVTATNPDIAVTDGGTAVTDNVTVVNVGSADQGATVSKTIRVTNAGTLPLSFTAPTVPAGYVIDSILDSGGGTVGAMPTLAPGDYVDVVIKTVATNAGGAKSGTLVFASDDPDTPSFRVKLSSFVNHRQVGVTYNATTVTNNQAGQVDLGTSTAASFTATIVVRNTGSGMPLAVTGVSLPTGYSVVTPLPGTIAAGASANLVVAIDTATVGTKAGTVTVTTDDPNTPTFSFPVTATVQHGIINVALVNDDTTTTPLADNGSAINYGATNQGILVTKKFRITNTGNAALTFALPTVPADFNWTDPVKFNPFPTIVPDLVTVPAGESREFTIAVRVNTGGAKAGTLVLNSSDPHTPAFDIPLTAEVHYRKIEVSYLGSNLTYDNATKLATPAINLSSIVETTNVQLTFRVTNTGDTLPLTLTAPTLPVGYTIVTPLPDSLAPGASADLVVRVNTTTPGTHADILTINSNDPLYALPPAGFRIPINYTVNYRRLVVTSLSGTPATAGSTVNFGTYTQGETRSFTYRLTNNGDLPMSLDNLSVPTGFLATGFPSTLAPGASADVTISLDLQGPRGTYAGAFSFTTNDPTNPTYSLNLSGKVLGKGIVVSLAGSAIPFGAASTVDFGRVRRGTPAQQITFTVSNSGTLPLAIQSTAIPAGYSVVGSLPDSLAPGASTQLTVALDTSTAGVFGGELHIVSSDPDRESFDIPLAAAVSLPVTLGKGGVPSVTYTDADGTMTTLTLSGPGSAVLDFVGSSPIVASTKLTAIVNPKGVTLAAITLSGTKANNSKLTITTKGGNNSVDLSAEITGTPLQSLSAPKARLTGTIDANVRTIEIASASGATLNLKAGAVLNVATTATSTAVTVAGNLKALKANSWTGGSITAASIDSLNIAGNFSPDLTLTKGVSGAIKGNVTAGTWNVGAINKLSVGATLAPWSATVNGAVTNFAVAKNLAGALTAKSLASLSVGGSVTGATLTSTGAVGTLAVTGNFQNSTLRSAGKVTSFSANAFTGSKVYAGLDPASTPPATPAIFKSAAAIQSLTVKSFVNSSVAAKSLGTVTIGTLKSKNGGAAHGLAASSIASLKTKLDTGKTLTLSNVKSGAQLTKALAAQKVTLGSDLRILMA